MNQTPISYGKIAAARWYLIPVYQRISSFKTTVPTLPGSVFWQ